MDMKSENNDLYQPWLVELPFEDGSWHTFNILLSIEESDFLKEVCKTFKARTISGENVADYYLSSYILKNADVLDMNKFLLLIELTFVVPPSTAHVERSFSLREDMLNNQFYKSCSSAAFNRAEAVLHHWIDINCKFQAALH